MVYRRDYKFLMPSQRFALKLCLLFTSLASVFPFVWLKSTFWENKTLSLSYKLCRVIACDKMFCFKCQGLTLGGKQSGETNKSKCCVGILRFHKFVGWKRIRLESIGITTEFSANFITLFRFNVKYQKLL